MDKYYRLSSYFIPSPINFISSSFSAKLLLYKFSSKCFKLGNYFKLSVKYFIFPPKLLRYKSIIKCYKLGLYLIKSPKSL